MKTIALLLLALAPVWAGTVEGTLDGTNNHWGTGGNVSSPVVLLGAVIVPSGITLTIEAGTEIQGSSSIDFQEGNVVTNGTSDSRIVFNQAVTILNARDLQFYYTTFNNAFVSVKHSGVVLKHCIFQDGVVALTIDTGSFLIENTIFRKCSQTAVSINHSSGTIRNISVDDVKSIQITVADSSSVHITNSIFSRGAYGVYATGTKSTVYVDYSLLNTIIPTYGNAGVVIKDVGVLESLDPQFVDTAAGDLHLQTTSPAIDLGHPGADYSLEPGGGGGRINMGAYGNTSEAALGESAVEAGSPAMAALPALEVFPNPVTRQAVFRTAQPGIIEIFDASGRTVAVLATGKTAFWNSAGRAGKPVPEGVYFCRFTGKNGKKVSVKLLVLR
jgi:hypothetical protein